MSHFYWLKLGVSILHVIPENPDPFEKITTVNCFFLIHKVSADVET